MSNEKPFLVSPCVVPAHFEDALNTAARDGYRLSTIVPHQGDAVRFALIFERAPEPLDFSGLLGGSQ